MSEQLVVTQKQRTLGNVAAIIVLVVTLTVMALSYFGVIGLNFDLTVVPLALTGVGLVFFCNAIIQKNPVSMWIAFAFLTPAVISFIANLSEIGYEVLYPLYIATPGIGCLAAAFMGRGVKSLIKAALIFILAAAIFALHSLGLLKLWIVLLIFLAYLLVLCVYVVTYLGKGENK